ncbi:hypothetical protein K466DRAFT_619072 [Polyporus arcularius HHB13444]|uniref:Uncharacterized protein n=1 Tax=Polyporus arcularius HHB13444 TaxID=1314778 RepID=A0A5C3PYR2_9APHY|nr:hypothetical protein K466DRAFT_619072 [Polyporus arcularius HHB13444]
MLRLKLGARTAVHGFELSGSLRRCGSSNTMAALWDGRYSEPFRILAALRPPSHPTFSLVALPHKKMYRDRQGPASMSKKHPAPRSSTTTPPRAHTLARAPSAYHLSHGPPHPIVLMPNRVLVKILAAVNPVPGTGMASWSPYWLPLMAVCQHWRKLIENTPDFWQKISVGLGLQWLELCLEHSQRSLVQVTFWSPVPFNATMNSTVLRSHWHRIEYLRFKALDCAQFDSSMMVPEMPELRTLIANVKHTSHSICDGSRHDGTGVMFSLPHGTLPHLKALTLEGTSLVADHVALSSLRLLYLGKYAGARPLYTTAQFVTMLSSCTSLERLTIAKTALHAITVVPNPSDDAGPVAHLSPRLRDLNIHGSVEHISNLLSHIHVPAHVDLVLSTEELTEERAAAAPANMLPPTRLRRNLGILRSATRLKVDSCHDEVGVIKVIATRKLGSSGRFEISVPVPGGKNGNGSQARRMYYRALLRAAPDMFPDAQLDTLVCAGDIDAISESEWRDGLLAHYPTLRTLVVDDGEYGGDATPVFKALGSTVAQLQLGAIGALCPVLEYLWIRNAEPTVKLMEDARTCLSRREYHQAAPLKRLRFELNPDYERPEHWQTVPDYFKSCLSKRSAPKCELRLWRRDVDDAEMFLDTSTEMPF